MLLLAHAGGAALWLGSMAYSLFVVQPRLPRMLGDEAAVEDAQRVLAHGNRWPVVAIISVLWLTGIGLVLTGDGTGWWWAGVALKAVLLAAATGLFWWVSWRGWPRRVFALPAELPGLQRRFRLVALGMFALVGAAFAAGMLLS
jgi:Flp pilus assembly protein TadB